MANNNKYAHPKIIEYMCTYCGIKETRTQISGRPKPGQCRLRKNLPHRWVKNREL